MTVKIVIFIADVDAIDVQLDTLEKAKNPTNARGYPKLFGFLLFVFTLFLSQFFFLFGSLLLVFLLLLATRLSFLLFFLLVLFFFAFLVALTNFKHPDYVLDLVRFVGAIMVIKVIGFGDVICTRT